jgi:hypothetical protein
MSQVKQGCLESFVGALLWVMISIYGTGAMIADWVLKIMFYSLAMSAFFATLHLGLQPMTAQNIANVFVGMNFITICLVEAVKTDKWFQKIIPPKDTQLERVGDLAMHLMMGDTTSEYPKRKNDHTRLEDENPGEIASASNQNEMRMER